MTHENIWPCDRKYELKFLWKARLGPKIQNWVPMQWFSYCCELTWGQIPILPLTLHWNQKYKNLQATISLHLHLRLCLWPFQWGKNNALGSLLTPWTKDVLDCDLETSSALCTKNALRLYLTRIFRIWNLQDGLF